MVCSFVVFVFFFFKQKTAYEMRISDWSSDVCSSDLLAAVRTSARETAEGWRINGPKIWTTGAHFSHIMLALVRTEEGSERNAGLSQLLIDLDAHGIQIRPIIDMAGHHDLKRVFLDAVLVPHGVLVGERGQGRNQ